MTSCRVLATYELVGFYAGRTIKFGDYQFVDGLLTTDAYTEEQNEKLARWLDQWGGRRNDGLRGVQKSRSLAVDTYCDLLDKPKGETSSSGDTGCEAGSPAAIQTADGLVSEGDGQAASLTMLQERLRSVVLGLAASDSSCWTKTGLPALNAVERALGSSGITRKMIEQVCPGYRRKEG